MSYMVFQKVVSLVTARTDDPTQLDNRPIEVYLEPRTVYKTSIKKSTSKQPMITYCVDSS